MHSQLRCLDLFCGAGGAGMGYYRAGYEVVGVDIAPQKHYPFTFYQADALEYVRKHGHEFDVIHASPPCQGYSKLTPLLQKAGHKKMIDIARTILISVGKHYVIENVEGAIKEMIGPVMLCGSMFGLGVWRHRLFECSFPVGLLPCCNHNNIPVLVSGTTRRKGYPRKDATISQKCKAMGINWMTTSEIDQAIPPEYTEWIGKQMILIL
jgi:DNA (cytosine-5)-methyltransferase 1